MKRNKVNKTIDLKHRLQLVRETVRELTPEELRRVAGGPGGKVVWEGCSNFSMG